MNRSVLSTIAMRSLVGGVVVAATLLVGAGDAHASSHIFYDNFENHSPAWSFWASSPSNSTGSIVSNANYAHSGTNFFAAGLNGATTSSDFSMAYRTFTAPEPGPVKSCSVFVELRGFNTETISIQMVNPDNWSYIGIDNATFTNANCTSPSQQSCYGHANLLNTWACSNSIQVRLVVTGGPGGPGDPRLGYVDDVSVTFNQ